MRRMLTHVKGSFTEEKLLHLRTIYNGYYAADVYKRQLLSGLLSEMSLRDAMQLAVDFTCGSIRRTREAGTDRRFGVNFEAGLPRFMEELGLVPVSYRMAR